MARTVKKNAKKKPVIKAKRTTSSAAGIDVGWRAPSFSLPATKMGRVSSAELSGKPYILYFYPKDDTSGCTAEACDFRDNVSVFNRVGAIVIGVSRDAMQSHEKFSAKYGLKFPLASDEDGKLCEKFGVWVQKSMYGRKYMGIERSTFLVDGKGIVRAAWRKVSVTGHVDEVKKALAAL